MVHSAWVQVESYSGSILFGLSDILGHFGLDWVWFSSDQFRVN